MRRVRMLITDDAASGALVAAAAPGARFHVLMILADAWTGDGRWFEAAGASWRDLPFPFMATDRADHGAMGADTATTLIGNFDRVEMLGAEMHGWGQYLSEPSAEASNLMGLVQRGELRGVSADIDDVEFEVLFPTEGGDGMGLLLGEEDEPAPDVALEEIDGQEFEVVPMPQPRLRVTSWRAMGATAVPFQAFMEAFVIDGMDAEGTAEPDEAAEPALVAGGARVLARHHVHGAVLEPIVAAAHEDATRARLETGEWDFPVVPPHAWFHLPAPDEDVALTILDSGQVYGYLALDGECHIGLSGQCVTAPRSACSYARFNVGECPTDEGRVAAGKLTFNCGHAPLSLGLDATRSFYDHSGQVAADVRATDGPRGIWLCGAARPGLTAAQVREVMTSPPSGDWRMFGGTLELVAALCVNVPGFNTRRGVMARQEHGMVASLIWRNAPERTDEAYVTLPKATVARVVQQLASSMGRSREQRVAALCAQVHGGSDGVRV